MNFNRYIKISAVFLIIFAWILTGSPLIWQVGNWRVPSEIQRAEAASSGPNNPSTTGTEAGGGTINWTAPENITSSDNNWTTAVLGKGIISYYLKGTGFGFSIPSNARIDGIKVEIERSIVETTSNVKDNSVKIIKGGTISGNENADTGTLWPVNSGDAYATYGGTTDLWGLSWTATDINSSNFGAAIQAKNTVSTKPTTETAQVDHMRITVYYTLPTMTVGTTGSQTSTMNIPSSDNYVGGAFTFITDINTATTTQILINEEGTVDANADISNLKIRYETAGTCTYDGNETYFNSTGVSFNASDVATATGTMLVGTSQVCVYVILDVGSGASVDETVEIEISNPSTEVTITNGTVTPSSPVQISGQTILQSTPTVSCNASTSTTAFGTLTTSVISTSTPDITITMSCTHANGCTLRVQDDGGGGNPGLYSTNASYLIGSANDSYDDTDALVQGTKGYGIQASTNANGSGGILTVAARYSQAGDNIGGLEITDVIISSSTEAITNRETVVKHKAAISNLTPAASDYSDILTYSCIGN